MFISGKGKPQFASTKHNIVFDGNSLIAGTDVGDQYLANRVHSLPILSSSGLTVKSYGVSGHNWSQMLATVSEVTSQFETGKRNILFIWESTNTLYNGTLTVNGIIASMQNYINAVKSSNSAWEIYNISTIARRQTSGGLTITQFNQVLLSVDDYVRKNYKAMGLAGQVELRLPNSPLYTPDFSDASFLTLDPYIFTGHNSSNNWIAVHLNQTGLNIVANLVSQKLRSIGVR